MSRQFDRIPRKPQESHALPEPDLGEVARALRKAVADGYRGPRPSGHFPQEAARLSERLLGHGGERALVDASDPDTPLVLDRGSHVSGRRARMFSGSRTNHCHGNCARVWRAGSWPGSIATGYALSEGRWVPHSWMVKDGTVWETTPVRRDAYYGYALSPQEADRFALENIL